MHANCPECGGLVEVCDTDTYGHPMNVDMDIKCDCGVRLYVAFQPKLVLFENDDEGDKIP